MRHFEINNINYDLTLWGPETFIISTMDRQMRKLLLTAGGEFDDIDWCRYLNAHCAQGFCRVEIKELDEQDAQRRMTRTGRPVFLRESVGERQMNDWSSCRADQTSYVVGR